MSRWNYDGGLSSYDEFEDEGEFIDDDLSVYAQCCRNCRFFQLDLDGCYGECENPDLDEFDCPSAKGDDCCELWEEREDHR